MSSVLATSVALAWCFQDEQTPAIMALRDRVTETGATAPMLWPLEALTCLLATLPNALPTQIDNETMDCT